MSLKDPDSKERQEAARSPDHSLLDRVSCWLASCDDGLKQILGQTESRASLGRQVGIQGDMALKLIHWVHRFCLVVPARK